jgi:hypothetical protein
VIPAEEHPEQRRGAWRLVGASLALLLLGVVVRLLSPAILLDIASLWPIGAVLLTGGWIVRTIWADRAVATIPIFPLLIFSWLVFSSSFYAADLPGLPSSSGDLRGPPVTQTDFDTFTVEMNEGRLLLSWEPGQSTYRVDMTRRGGRAGVPVALESTGGERAEVRVIDARDPLPPGVDAPVKDNVWLRFAGWEVYLNPETDWNLALSAPQITADLRMVNVASLTVSGQGEIQLGEASGLTDIAVQGTFTVGVPDQAPVEVIGATVVPQDWTVDEGVAWSGQRSAGWRITVAEGGSVQISTNTDG